ncbi:Plasmolipin, putative [Pediculus humanus corporis]|uniref:Plasmolipin, putative n=1 Tax=Pediculus humanus subsp. corporis TaxID=121224 RepID=E0V8W1_PEDHC|nr:Plasmolipin, putative [Pediculus humanus corporis]EEB09817.1 Plasmolipin, putative [Pediculus humanus corporis]
MAAASPARLSATSWFLFVVVSCFISTLIWIFVYLLSIREALKLPINWTLSELLNTIIKTVFYVTAFISQLSAWSPIHHSAWPRDSNLTAGSFGLFNTIAYAAGVYYLYQDWKYSQSNSGP